MKRGIHGVYHHTSSKHLGRYVDEFTFRLNDGNVKRHTLNRLDSFIANTKGIRLTYAGADGMKDAPDALNKIVDAVLAYKPKPKTKAAKKRKRLKVKRDKDKKPAD